MIRVCLSCVNWKLRFTDKKQYYFALERLREYAFASAREKFKPRKETFACNVPSYSVQPWTHWANDYPDCTVCNSRVQWPTLRSSTCLSGSAASNRLEYLLSTIARIINRNSNEAILQKEDADAISANKFRTKSFYWNYKHVMTSPVVYFYAISYIIPPPLFYRSSSQLLIYIRFCHFNKHMIKITWNCCLTRIKLILDDLQFATKIKDQCTLIY